MLYKTGRADGSHTNKGANMKEEWKICNIQTDHILDGEPESARCCAVALAMKQEIENLEEYKGYSPVITNVRDMHLEKSDFDDKEILEIDVFEEDRQDVDNFIWDFDKTYDNEEEPIPVPMRFRYRIIRSK